MRTDRIAEAVERLRLTDKAFEYQSWNEVPPSRRTVADAQFERMKPLLVDALRALDEVAAQGHWSNDFHPQNLSWNQCGKQPCTQAQAVLARALEVKAP